MKRWSIGTTNGYQRNDNMTITEMEIRFPGGQKVDAQYKGFTIHTDQPVEDGGGGSAPTPFSLFLASLGTCTGYYILSFCQRKGIPTKDIKAIAHIDRNPTSHMVERYAIDIHVPNEFPEQYKNAMVKSAESCIVKKHLLKPPQFTIAVV
jgi:putative redox protein